MSTSLSRPSHSCASKRQFPLSAKVWQSLLLGTALWGMGGLVPPVQTMAQVSPPTVIAAQNGNAPKQLTSQLAAMDAAAEQQKLSRLMRFYRDGFTHSDGLTRTTLKDAVKTFWQDYQKLNYTTELVNWKAEAGGYLATTKTTITGERKMGEQRLKLTSSIESQQQWVDGKLASQTILAEQTQINSGDNPPQVTVQLPTQVKVGERFNFDVIVDEPLGEKVLLGTALSEPISAQGYLKSPQLELVPLASGGLFKVGTAPKEPTQEWVSAVLVQDGGMTMISRRLLVVRK